MGWGWGGDAARTVRGAGGGAGRRGNLGARRASRASRPKERQEEPDFRHHPQTSRSDPSPSGRPLPRALPGKNWDAARKGTCELRLPLPRRASGKVRPTIEQIQPDSPPAPPSERTLDSPDASRLERGHPKFSGRHVVKISRPSYTWSGADDEDGSPGIPSPPVPQTTPPHPATVS